ncbi:MAG: GNAT family N-acetyltransferase [Bacteroidota bacterium]
MEVIPASKETKNDYRDFCSTEEALPIYVQDWYLDAVITDGNWEVILVKEKYNIIASFPYFQKQKLSFQYVTMPIFVKWMGLYIIPEHRSIKKEQKILQLILPLFSKFDAFKQNFYPSLLNWSALYWEGYQQTTFYTYQIDLSKSLEELLDKCNRNIQRNIKKASSQLSVKFDLSPEQFYEINKMSFDRQDITIPYSLSLFIKHDEVIQKKKRRKILYALDHRGNIHAASYLIWDQNSCYYHLSGENPLFRKSGAGILLVWKAIRFAKEALNLNLFDFEGSMMQNIAHIRQQFGSTAVSYNYIWKYNNTFYKLLDYLKKN